MIWIILILIGIIIYLSYKLTVKIEIDKEIIAKNKKEEEKQKQLENEKDKSKLEIEEAQKTLKILADRIKEAEYSADIFKANVQYALEQYGINLEHMYNKTEEEYDNLIKNLDDLYNNTQDRVLAEIAKEEAKLANIRSTRVAAIEAQIKEREIKEQQSFYCLQPTESEKDDIQALERVKPKLHQPRILCMLIWSTYFQKPMTALCNNILGTSVVCGIYKITNQETGECYIGQAADVAKRWKDHAKCGLGIDTPANNKLYKAIQEYGIWNFSWELLESCPKELLNEKENFYIELYDSKNYGYNSTIGIKKI